MGLFFRNRVTPRRRSPVRVVPLTDAQMAQVSGGFAAHIDTSQAQVQQPHHDASSVMPVGIGHASAATLTMPSGGGGFSHSDAPSFSSAVPSVLHLPTCSSGFVSDAQAINALHPIAHHALAPDGQAYAHAGAHAAHMLDHIDDIAASFGFGGGGGSSFGYDASPITPATDSWDNSTSPIAALPGPGPLPDACSAADLISAAQTGAIGGAIAGARGGPLSAAVGAGTGAALGALGFGINCADHIEYQSHG